MASKQYRQNVTNSLMVINPEQFASSTDSFTSSGTYQPDMQLLDAQNVLPSAQGYFSFFGKDLDFNDELSADIQDIISYRTTAGDTILIALCRDGLYIKSIKGTATPTVAYTPNTPSTDPNDPPRDRHLIGETKVTMPAGKCEWTNLISTPLGSPNPWSLWTWAIVNNKIYFYQQGLGYIANLYGDQLGVIMIDHLEPSFIIGSNTQFRWTIDGADSTDGSLYVCTDTTKSIAIPGLGDFHVFNLDKAHIVKNIVNQWREVLGAYSGMGYYVVETFAEDFDLDGSIHIDHPCNPIPGAGGDIDYSCLPNPLDTYTDPLVLQGDYYGTCRQSAAIEILSSADGYTSYKADLINGVGYFLDYSTNVLSKTLHINHYLVPLTLGNFPVVSSPTPDYSVSVDLSAYEYTTSNQVLHKFTGTDSALYYFTDHTGVGHSYKVAVWVDLQTGDQTEFFSMGNPAYVDSDYTFELKGCAYDAINDKYYVLLRFGGEPGFESFEGAMQVTPGTEYAEDYLLNRNNYIVVNTNFPESQTDIHFVFAETGAFLLTTSHSIFLVNKHGQVLSTLYDPRFSSILHFGICMVESSTCRIIYVAKIAGNIGYPNWLSWIILPDVINPLLYDANIQSLTSGLIDPNTPVDNKGLIYTPYLGYVPPNASPPPANIVGGTYWTKVNGVTWLVRAGGSSNTGDPWNAQSLIAFSGDVIANCLETPLTQTCADPVITLSHDGVLEELTYAWDHDARTLAVGGFKEFGLTTVDILADGVVVENFHVDYLEDGNDLWDKLLTRLALAFPTATITPTLTKKAIADKYYKIILTYIDFANVAPVPVLAHDGDCSWVLSTTENAEIKMAQVSGIASGRGRLIAWDRENAIYRSSNQYPVDFTPDIATQAGVGTLQPVQGDILLCLGWNNGFIVYATGNVTWAVYTGGTYVFNYTAISDSGVIDPRHVSGTLDAHFYWSNKGLVAINPTQGPDGVDYIADELTDWLNQHKYPIKTSYIGDRYLLLSVIEPIAILSDAAIRRGTPQYDTDTRGLRTATDIELTTFPYGSNIFIPYKITYVYDTVLKKWGRCDEGVKAIFSLNPVNAKGFPSEKSPIAAEASYYNRIRSLGAVLDSTETVIFNDSPDSSYLCFGHSKFAVAEASRVIEIDAEFVDLANAQIQIERSLDNRRVDWNKVSASPLFTSAGYLYSLDTVGQWFNTVIRGSYHLRSFTIRGFPHGKLRFGRSG